MKECDQSRVVTEHSLGQRLIGGFNQSLAVAKRRARALSARFSY